VLPGTPPGVYQIEVGMYHAATLDPLEPVAQDTRLLLGPVEIVRGSAGETPPPLENRVEASLDGQVALLGYELEGLPQPGGALHLTLFWRALLPPRRDYTVFVHLVGSDGVIRAQKDSQPVAGFYPASLWTEGELVRDQYELALPPGLPAGDYRLEVGLYEAGTGTRLPVVDERGDAAGDRVVLRTIQVEGGGHD
jgi:hypothetical protein